MRTTYTLLLASILVLSGTLLSACSSSDNPTASTNPPLRAAADTVLEEPKQADFTVTYTLESASREVKKGQEVAVKIALSGVAQAVTTASSYLTYDPALLEAVSVDLAESRFPTVFRNKINAETGVVELSQSVTPGADASGVMGDDQLVATVLFRARAVGTATVGFDAARSTVLLPDNTLVGVSQLPRLTLEIR